MNVFLEQFGVKLLRVQSFPLILLQYMDYPFHYFHTTSLAFSKCSYPSWHSLKVILMLTRSCFANFWWCRAFSGRFVFILTLARWLMTSLPSAARLGPSTPPENDTQGPGIVLPTDQLTVSGYKLTSAVSTAKGLPIKTLMSSTWPVARLLTCL